MRTTGSFPPTHLARPSMADSAATKRRVEELEAALRVIETMVWGRSDRTSQEIAAKIVEVLGVPER